MYILNLVPKVKSNNSLKLLLIDMKVDCTILVILEVTGMIHSKKICLVFIMVPQVREKKSSWIISLLTKQKNYK